MFFDFRKIPFTCAHLPGRVNLVGLGVMYILGFTAYTDSMAAVEVWMMASPAAAIIFFALAAAVLLTLRQRRASITAASTPLDYEDPGDPVVRTLGLSER
jgi:hypothetical protein